MNKDSVTKITSTKIKAYAVAKDGCFLPGGVKRWESAAQDDRETAKAILAAYIDGHEHCVSYSGTREASGLCGSILCQQP